MARRKQSPLEDLMEIGSRLPWKVGLTVALIAYLVFHYIASLPPIPIATQNMNSFSQSIGGSIGQQLIVTFSMFLQYIIPFAFITGAVISFLRQKKQQKLHSDVALNPSRNALESMTWREFEGLTAETFRRKGYRVVERGGNGPDGGVDLELHIGKDMYLVQCKQWKALKVGVATVRELYGVMAAEHAVGGFVVASGEFSEEAHKFAEGRSIKLIPTNSLLVMISSTAQNTSPAKDVTIAEPVCPLCGSAMVRRAAKAGKMAGNTFWGCSRFPACRGTRN